MQQGCLGRRRAVLRWQAGLLLPPLLHSPAPPLLKTVIHLPATSLKCMHLQKKVCDEAGTPSPWQFHLWSPCPNLHMSRTRRAPFPDACPACLCLHSCRYACQFLNNCNSLVKPAMPGKQPLAVHAGTKRSRHRLLPPRPPWRLTTTLSPGQGSACTLPLLE